MLEEPFKKAEAIVKRLIEAGYAAYFVGGSVRDVLLNRQVGDIDIATSATPQEVQALFERTIPIGIEHGTVAILHQNECFEVTTFREDGEYHDYRHPSKVEFVTSLIADLSRRDFTINAIAMDIDGRIIDPFDGQGDMDRKRIKTVGTADDRFREDPLRMMRALRFLSVLDFQLSEDTSCSIKKNGHLLSKIAIERILVEFEKLLIGKSCDKAINSIVELGLYPFMPGFQGKQNELLQFSKMCRVELNQVDEYWSLLLLHLQIVDITPFFRKWKTSNERINKCKAYLLAYQELKKLEKVTPMLVYRHGVEIMRTAIKLYTILHHVDGTSLTTMLAEIIQELPIQSRSELAVTGRDLLHWFKQKGGPWLAVLIEKIEIAVVNKEVANEKADIKEWLETCNPQFEINY